MSAISKSGNSSLAVSAKPIQIQKSLSAGEASKQFGAAGPITSSNPFSARSISVLHSGALSSSASKAKAIFSAAAQQGAFGGSSAAGAATPTASQVSTQPYDPDLEDATTLKGQQDLSDPSTPTYEVFQEVGVTQEKPNHESAAAPVHLGAASVHKNSSKDSHSNRQIIENDLLSGNEQAIRDKVGNFMDTPTD